MEVREPRKTRRKWRKNKIQAWQK